MKNRFFDYFKAPTLSLSTVGALFFFLSSELVFAERIKDMASVAGVRTNQLVGYGLVVGLDGSGDQTSQAPFTVQTFKNMMEKFGITIPDELTPQLKNVAAVSVHAELPPFIKIGQKIDVTVSSLANAKSLRGGTLIMTTLKGADGRVYGVAQGNLVVGGFGAEGGDGSKIQVNIPSVGRIPNGASVERVVPTDFFDSESLTFNLHGPDFTNAKRVADRINQMLGPGTAVTEDAVSIRVRAPRNNDQRIAFISVLENLEIQPAEAAAKIIINSRTGTIVIGSHVKVSPTAVTHGRLTVTVSESMGVSQPEGFSQGETVVTTDSDVVVEEDINPMFLLDGGVSLESLVRAVNQVGAAPGDLMAILEALKQAGALRAELIVI